MCALSCVEYRQAAESQGSLYTCMVPVTCTGWVDNQTCGQRWVQPGVMAHDALQVIPDDLRSSAYAFDKGITGLLGALAAPLVGIAALSVSSQRPPCLFWVRIIP